MKKISTTVSPWKSYEKIGFRFALLFFIQFITLLDWSVNPVLTYLYYYGHLATGLDALVSMVGKHFFDISYVIVSPYDGEHNDRTYVYILYFIMIMVATLGTIAWSLADKKRQHYNVFYYWFTVVLRYYLAFTMFLFGLYKFFRIQFPDLGYYTLTETLGDMSPMHLAWAFFGYSHGYNVFMGLAESAGLLLLFRRTTTLGALLTMAALTNVVAVNYSFDVHAKIYPTTLLFIALFLLLRDAKRIGHFFFTGQATSLSAIKSPVFQKRWMRTSKTALKILVIGFFLYAHVKNTIGYQKSYQKSLSAKSQYTGIYDVESSILNGDTLSKEHPLRWNQIVIGDRMLEAIRYQKDSVAFASIDADEKEIIVSGSLRDLRINMQKIYNEFGSSDDTYYKMDSILVARQIVSRFNIELSDATTLLVKGAIKNDSVHIVAKRRNVAINEFRLIKRRFHWINEASYFY